MHPQMRDVNIIFVVYAVTNEDNVDVYLPLMPAFTVLSAKLVLDYLASITNLGWGSCREPNDCDIDKRRLICYAYWCCFVELRNSDVRQYLLTDTSYGMMKCCNRVTKVCAK
jgi:hypothetical protein